MKKNTKLSALILILSKLCFCGKNINLEQNISRSEVSKRTNDKLMHEIAENSGKWHNEFVELGLSN